MIALETKNSEQILRWLREGGYVDYLELRGIHLVADKLNGKYPEFDRELVRHASLMASDFTEEDIAPDRDSWHWHMDAISKGEYPFELLPPWVQLTAMMLYYENITFE